MFTRAIYFIAQTIISFALTISLLWCDKEKPIRKSIALPMSLKENAVVSGVKRSWQIKKITSETSPSSKACRTSFFTLGWAVSPTCPEQNK